MIRRMQFRRVALATALAVASPLVLAAPAQATPAPGQYPSDGASVAFGLAPDFLPALDPSVGRGDKLAGGVATPVALGTAAEGAHSALVRVSAFEASEDTVVSVSGAPGLSLSAGTSASTTVLVPVRDAAIELQSSTDVSARVELLATFSSDRSAPGATVALDAPVTRADTGEGLGAPSDAATFSGETEVGVLGLGGVPAQDVRAAHVSVTVQAENTGAVVVDDQRIEVPAGTFTFSTVVTPSSQGDVLVEADEDVRLRVDVRGYVVEAPENVEALNGAGAFWPAEDIEVLHGNVSDTASYEVQFSRDLDATHVLAVVTATAANDLTALEIGTPYEGRARGAIVDPALGARAQLALIPTDDAHAMLRRGSTSVTIQPIGYFLSEEVAPGASPTISLTSPTETSIDTGETLAVAFEGIGSTPGSAPLRIEVSKDGEAFGSAAVRPSAEGFTWGFTAPIQESGNHRFEFTLVDRSGASVSTSWSADVTIPGPEDTIVQDDAVVIPTENNAPDVLATTDKSVTFDEDPRIAPGKIIVSAARDGAPAGFIRRVEAIDIVNGEYVVRTTPAAFTDVFLQAHLDDELPLPANPEVALETPAPEYSDEYEALSLEAISADEVAATQARGEISDERSIDAGAVADFGGNFTHSLEIKGTVKNDDTSLSSAASVAISLKVKLAISLRWTEGTWLPPVPPVPYPQVDDFSTTLVSSNKAQTKLSFESEAEWKKEWKQTLATVKFAPITVPVGPIPVVLVPQVTAELKAKVSLSGAASFTLTASYERKHEVGFQYKNGTAGPINNGPTSTFTPPDLTKAAALTGTLTAEIGPRLGLTISVFDAAGPELGLGLALKASAEAKASGQNLEASVNAVLTGNLDAKVKFKVPVVDKELLDVEVLRQHGAEWHLFSATCRFLPLPFTCDPENNPPTGEQPEPTPTPTPSPDDEVDYGDEEGEPAPEEAESLDVQGADVLGAHWVEGPPDPSAAGVFDRAVGGFPTESSDYLVMSTGRAERAFEGYEHGGFLVPSPRGPELFDVSTLRIDLDIPEGVNCLVDFDFRFYSDEYPDYVGSDFNDAFVAELDKSTWTVGADNEIVAPRNFAFDQLGNPITINAAGPWTINTENAEGTTYGGATSKLRATTPVTPGQHSLFLSIFDLGDSIFDSAVFVDGVTFGSVENPAVNCKAGVTE